MWDDREWGQQLTRRLRVNLADEWIPVGEEIGRKSWYLALTQKPDLATTLGPVRGVPKGGKTLLLFEDYVSIGLAGTGIYWINYFGRAPRQVGTSPVPTTQPAQLTPPGQPASPCQLVAGTQSRSRWWQQKGFPP